MNKACGPGVTQTWECRWPAEGTPCSKGRKIEREMAYVTGASTVDQLIQKKPGSKRRSCTNTEVA